MLIDLRKFMSKLAYKSVILLATFSQLKTRSTFCLPRKPISLARCSSASIATMARDKASVSLAGTNKPFRPWSTM
uniref:Uncharacterized protein n=1 Tax=Romanomermis culicivorax TaxID=13658 RepID=A0A915KUP5_ROMCU